MAKKEKTERTSVLTLQVVTALARTARPPKFDAPPPAEAAQLVPCGPVDGWRPPIWAKNGAKWGLVVPTNPWRTFERVLALVQKRIRVAGNQTIIELWLNHNKPKDERTAPGTIAYRTLCAHLVGGDPKQGEEVPHVASDVSAAVSRRIEKLCDTLWGRKTPTIPTLSERWPIWLRPSGWRFTSKNGREIAVNIDGTWWQLGLALPRASKKGKRPPDPYVFTTLRRMVAAEHLRGKTHEEAVPTADLWVPSTLGLRRKGKKWYAMLSYRQPLRPPLPVQNALIVHLGLRAFAVAIDLDGVLGRKPALWIDGRSLHARKFAFRKQYQRLQRDARKFATHGRGHKYQGRRFVDEKEQAFVDDWLRRRAARIVQQAKRTNARIFVMSTTGMRDRVDASDLPHGVKLATHRVPWFRFAVFIEQAAQREGIPVEPYTARYHTKRCPNPACGVISASAPRYDKTWRFVCPACKWEASIETVAAHNAVWDLAHAGRIQLPADLDVAAMWATIEAEAKARAAARKQNTDAAIVGGLSKTPRTLRSPRRARAAPRNAQSMPLATEGATPEDQ